MATLTISVKALIPVVDYGSLTIDATWTEEINEAQEDRSAIVIEGIKRLQNDTAMALLPLVESEIDRAAAVLLKDHDPDVFMRRNCKIYNWFKIVNPDVIIPAMAAILASKEIPNQESQRLPASNTKRSHSAKPPYSTVYDANEGLPGEPSDYGDK